MAELKEGFDLATLIIPQHRFTLFTVSSTPPTMYAGELAQQAPKCSCWQLSGEELCMEQLMSAYTLLSAKQRQRKVDWWGAGSAGGHRARHARGWGGDGHREGGQGERAWELAVAVEVLSAWGADG